MKEFGGGIGKNSRRKECSKPNVPKMAKQSVPKLTACAKSGTDNKKEG